MYEQELIPFSEIKLTHKEENCLKRLSSGRVFVDEKNQTSLNRLYRLGLAYPVCRETAAAPKQAAIHPRGEDYLVYLKSLKTQSKVEWIRYAITTGIAVAAFVKSFFF